MCFEGVDLSPMFKVAHVDLAYVCVPCAMIPACAMSPIRAMTRSDSTDHGLNFARVCVSDHSELHQPCFARLERGCALDVVSSVEAELCSRRM